MFLSKLFLFFLLTWLIWSSSASKSSSKLSGGESDISPTDLSENEDRHPMRPPPRFGKRLPGQRLGVKFYKHHNHYNQDQYQLNYDQFDNQDKLNYNPVIFHLNPVKLHLRPKLSEHLKARFTGLKFKHFRMVNHDVKCFQTSNLSKFKCKG